MVSGVRREVPLMEEVQVINLFVVLSHARRSARTDWEATVRFGLEATANHNRTKSPYFEHDYLTSIQDEILEKVVKKYQRKYINTDLNLK